MIRCTDCAAEFDSKTLSEMNATCCPNCKTESIPCDTDYDVELKINWHELRILAIWASNWAEKLEDRSKITLTSILRRISEYRPKGAPALTLIQEIKELQNEYPSATLIQNGEVIIPPKEDKDKRIE